ncbi:MAG: DivIVA domain-containing protein, partial [Halanaerobiaceae bacterium]|nr:DivIVA domain-containing protein [Halanaerobiaceae bacterium]
MKISPLDIYNREFSKATFGYNTRQVHEFLEEVGAAYEILLKEVNMLQDENEKLKEKLASQTEMEEKLKKIMLTIQDTAREITEQAHQEADIIIKKAEIKAEKMEMELKERLKEEYKALQ